MGIKKENEFGARIVSPVGHVIFAAVTEPEKPGVFGPGGNYKLVLGFSKSTDIEVLKKSVLDLARAQWGANISFKDFAHPFRDGDKKISKKTNAPDERYSGMTYLSAKASAKNPPRVVNAAVEPFTGFLGSGSTVKASLTPMTYETPERGITFRLGNVQVITVVSNGRDPADEFSSEVEPSVMFNDDDIPF